MSFVSVLYLALCLCPHPSLPPSHRHWLSQASIRQTAKGDSSRSRLPLPHTCSSRTQTPRHPPNACTVATCHPSEGLIRADTHRSFNPKTGGHESIIPLLDKQSSPPDRGSSYRRRNSTVRPLLLRKMWMWGWPCRAVARSSTSHMRPPCRRLRRNAWSSAVPSKPSPGRLEPNSPMSTLSS